MKIENVLNKIRLVYDPKYNIIVEIGQGTDVPQIVFSNVNIKSTLEKVVKNILEEYKITYKNDDVELFSKIFLKSYLKYDYHKENIPISALLVYEFERDLKASSWNANYILSNSEHITNILDVSVIFHQLDFNLNRIVELSLFNLRVFLLGFYSTVLKQSIEIKTPNDILLLKSDIDVQEINGDEYVFNPKYIRLIEKKGRF